jgi:hypothetical protein
MLQVIKHTLRSSLITAGRQKHKTGLEFEHVDVYGKSGQGERRRASTRMTLIAVF